MGKIYLIYILLISTLMTSCGIAPLTSAPASPTTEAHATATLTPTNPSLTSTDTAISTPEPTTPAVISFSNDILPLFQNRCRNCHGGNKIEEGLILLSYNDIMAGSDNGSVVIPGDAENSLLVEMLLKNKMPKRGPKLTPIQVQLIVDWINQGALNN